MYRFMVYVFPNKIQTVNVATIIMQLRKFIYIIIVFEGE